MLMVTVDGHGRYGDDHDDDEGHKSTRYGMIAEMHPCILLLLVLLRYLVRTMIFHE